VDEGVPKPHHRRRLTSEESSGGGDAVVDPVQNLWGNLESRPGKHVVIDGVEYLNVATSNYLGLIEHADLGVEAERCIRKYGVGSCGPRGFYGSVDVLLELEEKIADFLGLEEAALYSYGFSTIASAIPSYSKAGDIIFADEHVNFPIQRGLQASRSIIKMFRHNDPRHFEELLEEQAKLDAKNPKKAKTVRRFCVVEGIYAKTGEMCPLKEISVLCKKHKVRLIVEESISFGVLGKTGRGITEHLNVPLEDVDFISGSLEHCLAAFGGFIVGSSYVVDHQRISGLGYCFSASLPPLLAGVGIKSLSIIKDNPGIVGELRDKCLYFHTKLKTLTHFRINGHEESPIKHVILAEDHHKRSEAHGLLNEIIRKVKENHRIALVKPSYLEKQEHFLLEPSIRISVNRLLTETEIDRVVDAIQTESFSVLS